MNVIKKWLLEKVVIESLERTGNLPQGTSRAVMAYTAYMLTPEPIKSRVWSGSQRVVGRGVMFVDSPRGFQPGTHQPFRVFRPGTLPASRSLHADTSTGRYRGPLPGSRPATVSYGVPRIGGGILALPALNLGLGIMVAGSMMEFIERDSHITDAT